jgi:hypothetical protein
MRFQDTGETLHSFFDERLVVCPKCTMCAQISSVEFEDGRASETRVSCSACHYVSAWAGSRAVQYQFGQLDGLFGLSLWLQIPCCGQILWAYNARHLSFLEQYVAAKLRSRNVESGCSNRSLTSRLPVWIKSRKHRPEILKAIAILKAKLVK